MYNYRLRWRALSSDPSEFREGHETEPCEG